MFLLVVTQIIRRGGAITNETSQNAIEGEANSVDFLDKSLSSAFFHNLRTSSKSDDININKVVINNQCLPQL